MVGGGAAEDGAAVAGGEEAGGEEAGGEEAEAVAKVGEEVRAGVARLVLAGAVVDAVVDAGGGAAGGPCQTGPTKKDEKGG